MYEITIKGFKTVEDIETFVKKIGPMEREVKKISFHFQEISLYDLILYKIRNENPDGVSIFCLDKDADPKAQILFFEDMETAEKHFSINGHIIQPKNKTEEYGSSITFIIDEEEYTFDFGNTYIYTGKK